jgi:hypothetical protein
VNDHPQRQQYQHRHWRARLIRALSNQAWGVKPVAARKLRIS